MAKVLVEIRARDYQRVIDRIKILDGIRSITEVDEETEDSQISLSKWDLLVKCGPSARKFDVEELLLGVQDVTVSVQ